MRDPCCELADESELLRFDEIALYSIELGRHLVEGRRDGPHLVARPDRHANNRSVPARQPLNGRSQLAERASHSPGRPRRDPERGGERQGHRQDDAVAQLAGRRERMREGLQDYELPAGEIGVDCGSPDDEPGGRIHV